jgi:hypothetical protein
MVITDDLITNQSGKDCAISESNQHCEEDGIAKEQVSAPDPN